MAHFAFKFISGKYQGGEFPIPEEGELLIGRSNDLDLVLVEDMVSRKHAKLVSSGMQITITDLGSTNGTFVNGEKIRRTDLETSDRILIGTSILKVIDANTMTINHTDPNALREMMEELGSRASETSTMSGDLEDVPLPDLLQLFATNKKSGVLVISGANRGKLYIHNGQLLYSTIGTDKSIPPMKALCRMIGWKKGTFEMEPYDENAEYPETFGESTESILMESCASTTSSRSSWARCPRRSPPWSFAFLWLPDWRI